VKNIVKIILNIFKYKIIFSKIDKKKYLLIHNSNSDILTQVIKKNKLEIVHYVDEVNIRLFNIKLLKEINLLNYLIEYIKKTDPEFILSFIDNNPTIYKLKKKFKNKKFISIQNGIRRNFHFNSFPKLQLKNDIVFIFNNSLKNLYQKYITSNFKVIGSFKNNMISLPNICKKRNSIGYISQYRDQSDKIIFVKINGKTITYKDWRLAEIKLVKKLAKFANENYLDFSIIGTSNEKKEKIFYDKILKNFNFNFFYRPNTSSSYKNLSKIGLIFAIDSTLAYEALSHYKKIIFFDRSPKVQEFRFGYPNRFKKKGFFYSDIISDNEIKRLFNNVMHINQIEWKKKINSYLKNLMVYDKQNKIFKKNLLKIGALKSDFRK
jgi:surface carbohydrate biosynthesis protein